jgi:hypothetical protein
VGDDCQRFGDLPEDLPELAILEPLVADLVQQEGVRRRPEVDHPVGQRPQLRNDGLVRLDARVGQQERLREHLPHDLDTPAVRLAVVGRNDDRLGVVCRRPEPLWRECGELRGRDAVVAQPFDPPLVVVEHQQLPRTVAELLDERVPDLATPHDQPRLHHTPFTTTRP